MPVDYSKWDNLELSDDSDIEVHPNVDKRSFIRAKQNQIHQERMQRKNQIESFKYDRVINDGLIRCIKALLAGLRAHASDEPRRNPNEVAFQAIMGIASQPSEDKPPPPPEGLTRPENEGEMTYSKMMTTLLEQVNEALDGKKPEDRYTAMIEEIQSHEDKVQGLQSELLVKLAELEKEDARKITSEAYHTGFDSSQISKGKAGESSSSSTGAPSSSSAAATAAPQLLNPNFQQQQAAGAAGSGGDDEEIEASAEGKKFAQIKTEDYTSSARFLSQHPQILTERETDGILVLAFDAALEGKDELARQYVHQALLLQYCRSLGPDGVSLFFKRVTTRGHQAQEMFYKDVQDTYGRIRNRSREIVRERAMEEEAGGVEQIQLHAMDPGTVIQIRIPPADSDDEEVKQARAIFESFSPEMRKALESESLDKVNKVLGEMKVPEAEELVSQLGEANILSLEEQIIDATTEEGQRQLEEMEKAGEAEEKEEEGKVKYDDPE